MRASSIWNSHSDVMRSLASYVPAIDPAAVKTALAYSLQRLGTEEE